VSERYDEADGAAERVLADVGAARADARAQGSLASDWMPYLPVAETPFLPDDVDPGSLTWAETVAPGGYTHLRVARGTRIRFDDPTGDACAHLLLFNALEPGERLNVADTQKIPWQAYLGEGHPLLSGDGRVLATITTDNSGHHDAFCGTSSDAWNVRRYGDAAPEGPSPSGHALFVLGGAKHGLASRDLPPSISLFQGVRVGDDGGFLWEGSSGPGGAVELRAELALIVLVANVPHPLDPRHDYVSGPLRVHAWRDRVTDPTDGLFSRSPELRRAYLNTIAYAEVAGQ